MKFSDLFDDGPDPFQIITPEVAVWLLVAIGFVTYVLRHG